MTHINDPKRNNLTAGYRGPLRKGEYFQAPEMRIEEPLQNCAYIMNRRNIRTGHDPQPVSLDGYKVDPIRDSNQVISHYDAKWKFLDDGFSSFDGVSLVLPSTPKPITIIDHQPYFLVAGLYKNSCKILSEWNYLTRELEHFEKRSQIFLADMVSLGNPLCGLGPTGNRNYFFGLSSKPIAPFEDKNKTIFSYGGVIAIGHSIHDSYKDTGVESTIKILSPSALKLIEKWRAEASKNDF